MTQEKLMEMSIERLCDIFEMTTKISDKNICVIRGWLMDAIEAKNPEGFENWLDSDDNDDSSIREYVIV